MVKAIQYEIKLMGNIDEDGWSIPNNEPLCKFCICITLDFRRLVVLACVTLYFSSFLLSVLYCSRWIGPLLCWSKRALKALFWKLKHLKSLGSLWNTEIFWTSLPRHTFLVVLIQPLLCSGCEQYNWKSLMFTKLVSCLMKVR